MITRFSIINSSSIEEARRNSPILKAVIPHIPKRDGRLNISTNLTPEELSQKIREAVQLPLGQQKERLRTLAMSQASVLRPQLTFEGNLAWNLAAVAAQSKRASPEMMAACLQAAIAHRAPPVASNSETSTTPSHVQNAMNFLRKPMQKAMGKAQQLLMTQVATEKKPTTNEHVQFCLGTGVEYAESFFNEETPGHRNFQDQTGVVVTPFNDLNALPRALGMPCLFFQTPCIVSGIIREDFLMEHDGAQKFLPFTNVRAAHDVQYTPIHIDDDVMPKDDTFLPNLIAGGPTRVFSPAPNYPFYLLARSCFPVVPKEDIVSRKSYASKNYTSLVERTITKDPAMARQIAEFMYQLDYTIYL